MDTEEIINRITPIFADIFGNPDIQLSESTTADDIEKWDSLTNVNLIMAIEKEFGIRFALGELKQLKNVGEMMRLVQEKSA